MSIIWDTGDRSLLGIRLDRFGNLSALGFAKGIAKGKALLIAFTLKAQPKAGLTTRLLFVTLIDPCVNNANHIMSCHTAATQSQQNFRRRRRQV